MCMCCVHGKLQCLIFAAHLCELRRVTWNDGRVTPILGIQILDNNQRFCQLLIAICMTSHIEK